MRKSVLGKKAPRQSTIFAQSLVKQHGIELKISSFEEVQEGAFVNFILDVNKNEKHWVTKKRYSEFHFFYQAVQHHCGKLKSSFPPKTIGKLSSEALEKRREGLETWFQDFLDNVAMGPELQSQLDAFLAPKGEENEDGNTLPVGRSQRIDNLSRLNPGTVLKVGHLQKLGGNKTGSQGNWKRRYFVLQDDMKYFEDEATFRNGGKGKGLVKLNVFFVSVSDGDNPNNQFTVHAMPHPLVCRADTKEEMQSWVETLNGLADLGR